jgi:hypothetical protein
MPQPEDSIPSGNREGESRICHVRIRPKLVLKVTARPVATQTQQKPLIVQESSWDEVHTDDETDTDDNDDDDLSFRLLHKKKRAARRSQWDKKKKRKTNCEPAPAIPEPQPANRARIPARGFGQRVGFVETTVVHELPEDPEDEKEDGPTAMEKMMQLERLKEWVLERSPGGLGEMGWVRRLVELEMVEL